jgi:hypothetical protein
MSRFQQTILDQVDRTACAWRQNKLHEEIFNLVAAGQFKRGKLKGQGVRGTAILGCNVPTGSPDGSTDISWT